MKVLMLSLDKTLLRDAGYQGDTLTRHRLYGERLAKLDIIVFCRRGQTAAGGGPDKISDKVSVYPTNSVKPLGYYRDSYRQALKLQTENHYDLLACQDYTAPTGWLLKRRFKLPLIINFHGDYWNNYWLRESWFNPAWLKLFNFLARRADGLRVTSSGLKQKLLKLGVASDKIRVINTPINTAIFQKPDEQKLAALKKKYAGHKIILYVGRLVKLKNIPLVFEAVQDLKKTWPVKFLIIGRGGERENLQQMVSVLKLESAVEFVDTLPVEELVNYYCSANVLVLPSWHESFGKVLVEAGLAGCPVIATPTSGSGDIVKDGETGFIIGFNDAAACREKCAQLFRDQVLAQKMGENACRYLTEKFDQQRTINQIIKFWQDIVDG